MTECDCAYGFVMQQRYPTVESDIGARLHRNIGALAFEVRAPFVIVMMLMLVQGAVRVEDVIQHWCIRRHRSLRRRRRFRRNRVRRQRQFCNTVEYAKYYFKTTLITIKKKLCLNLQEVL